MTTFSPPAVFHSAIVGAAAGRRRGEDRDNKWHGGDRYNGDWNIAAFFSARLSFVNGVATNISDRRAYQCGPRSFAFRDGGDCGNAVLHATFAWIRACIGELSFGVQWRR